MPPSPYAACTLFEGSYHYGAGALVNSLYRRGFRGTVWAGYRGPRPLWATPVEPTDAGERYVVAEGCEIRFVHLDTTTHFTHYKADFLDYILDHSDAAGVFYFDPDIIVKGRWGFFEEWVDGGVALCEDVTYPMMPHSHPFRTAWRKVIHACGYSEARPLERYYNAGFIGVRREHREVLTVWRRLLAYLAAEGLDLTYLRNQDRSYSFYVPDQDMMNAALMALDVPINALGPEGMDFTPGGFTMSHAIDEPKPWQKNIVLRTLLAGTPPDQVDKLYWQHTQAPIELYPPWRHRMKWATFLAGRALGTVYHRH